MLWNPTKEARKSNPGKAVRIKEDGITRVDIIAITKDVLSRNIVVATQTKSYRMVGLWGLLK